MSESREAKGIRIEPATADDLGEIAALAAITWRASYPGIISPAQIEYMLERIYDLRVLKAELASGIVFHRALVNEALCGFSSFGPTESAHEFKLHKLYVHPDWQRRGIGRALLNETEHLSAQQGVRNLVLNVNKRNERAIVAYRKHGFTIRKSVVVDIGGGFVMDDYIMVKPIKAARAPSSKDEVSRSSPAPNCESPDGISRADPESRAPER